MGIAENAVQPFGEIVADQRRSWEMGATMFVAFGGLALLVAEVGLYGVIGYDVCHPGAPGREGGSELRAASGPAAHPPVRVV